MSDKLENNRKFHKFFIQKRLAATLTPRLTVGSVFCIKLCLELRWLERDMGNLAEQSKTEHPQPEVRLLSFRS